MQDAGQQLLMRFEKMIPLFFARQQCQRHTSMAGGAQRKGTNFVQYAGDDEVGLGANERPVEFPDGCVLACRIQAQQLQCLRIMWMDCGSSMRHAALHESVWHTPDQGTRWVWSSPLPHIRPEMVSRYCRASMSGLRTSLKCNRPDARSFLSRSACGTGSTSRGSHNQYGGWKAAVCNAICHQCVMLLIRT